MSILRTAWDLVTWKTTAPPIARASGWESLELKSASQTAPILPLNRGSSGWSNGELDRIIRDAYSKIGVIYACINRLADAVSEAPLMAYQLVDGEEQEFPDHPVSLLLREPNTEMDGKEFIHLVVTIMATFGYCPIEKVRGRYTAQPVALIPRSPTNIRRRVDGDTELFEVLDQGRVARTLKREDVIIARWQFEPQMRKMAISPVEVIAREAGIDSALIDFVKLFVANGAVSQYALVRTDPIYDEAVVKTMKAAWHQAVSGGRSFVEPPVLHGGMDVKKIGADLNELAWLDLRGMNELRIAQVFNVPPKLIGAYLAVTSGSLGEADMREARKMLHQDGAAPIRSRLDGAFTRDLLREFEMDRRWSLAFDLSRVTALQEDRDKIHDRARADLQAGGITLNAYLTETGREEIGPKGEVRLVSFNTVFVTEDDLIPVDQPDATTPVTDPPVDPVVDPGKGRRYYRNRKAIPEHELQIRASLETQHRRNLGKLSEIGARQLRKFWKEQAQRITSSYLRSGIVPSRKDIDDIDWVGEEEKLKEVLGRLHQESAKTGHEAASATLNSGVDWNLANPNVSRVINDLGGRITGISDTTRADISRIIELGANEGLTIDEIAGGISALLNEGYAGRSVTVARTETMVAYNKGSVLGYTDAGVTEVEFLDNPDHDEDYGASDGLTCATRNGLVTSTSAAGDHIDAEHPNGSLAVLPVITEDT